MLSYLPVLLISGLITGVVIAKLSSLIIVRISPFIKKESLYSFFHFHKKVTPSNENEENKLEEK